MTMVEALKKAGKDLTRERFMKAVMSLNVTKNPFMVPGIAVKTGAGDRFPIEQMLLQRWNKGVWRSFGGVWGYRGAVLEAGRVDRRRLERTRQVEQARGRLPRAPQVLQRPRRAMEPRRDRLPRSTVSVVMRGVALRAAGGRRPGAPYGAVPARSRGTPSPRRADAPCRPAAGRPRAASRRARAWATANGALAASVEGSGEAASTRRRACDRRRLDGERLRR